MDLYETTPGATVRGIAQDLGVERGTLRQWLARYATGRKTGADGSPAVSRLRPRRSDDSRAGGQTQETASEPIARLAAANAEPHTQAVKLGPGSRWDPFSRRPSMSRWWRRSAKSLFPGSLRTTGTPMRSNGCGLVEVARSSYYAWRAGRPARERRSATDAALREPITRTAQDRPGHGLAQDHCITAGLNEATQEAGGRVNRKRVARLMHAAGTRRLPQAAPGAHHRAGPVRHGGAPTCSSVTSQPRPPTTGTSVTFPHCVGGAPSYLPLADGTNLYLATVIDCARPAPGRMGAARPHAHAPLVIEALQQAAARPLKGA